MRTHAFRLTPGADLKGELQRLTEQIGLRAGCIVSCVGSLSRARLRMPGAGGDEEVFETFAEPMEILSLAGTLCLDGLHLHISLGRRDASCIGGHVVRGCIVNTTAELVIGELAEVDFHRSLDPATGYGELGIRPKAGESDTSPGAEPARRHGVPYRTAGGCTMAQNNEIQGEGNYDAARRFQKEEHKFVESGKVERKAREAEEALDGPEGEELERARRETGQIKPD